MPSPFKEPGGENIMGREVLVAEDHPVNQKVMGLLLHGLGVESTIVSDGQAAIEAAAGGTFSIILMDIMMPEADGFQASFAIRKMELGQYRHTPIIACTALDLDGIKDQLLRCGMDDYLRKPIGRQALKEKLERWADISIQTRAMTKSQEEHLEQLRSESGAESEEPINKSVLEMLYGLEQLDDILALFMTVTTTLLAQLESAIEHKDVAVVKRMAHEIKGSSYAISAREMSRLCLSLERAGEEQKWNEAERLYTALGLAFARVREFWSKKQQSLNNQAV